ncbi:MAG: water stress/hypersensitive response domain-containing protein [Alphaproteobacteria bacterium]|nr:water stress/hypersensitive response domain-containing protein [Alphaproteobacteria bacterium]
MTHRDRPGPKALLIQIARSVAIAALVVVGACSTIGVERPRVFVEDIRPIGGGALSQRFELVLRLQNPNDSDLHVRGMSFDLDLNGGRFASGVSNQRVTIPRLGSATMTVDASTSTFDLLAQVFRLSNNPTLDYNLHGKVLVDGTLSGSVPFEDGGEITLTRPTS